MTQESKEILKILQQISGRYSTQQVFSDWVETCALAFANNSTPFQDRKLIEYREEEYLRIVKKYTKEEADKFACMFGLLQISLGKEMSDTLGRIYMQSESGNKRTGQFFTPYHISLMCAKVGISEAEPDEHGHYYMLEPSCGSGGMIIAAAQALKEQGKDYQRIMRVIAQDLDWRSVYMCYVQLSLLGIHAAVVQGNTLSDPYMANTYPPERVFRTPMATGALL